MRKIALIASLLFLAPGLAQAKSLEDLLVEKGVITQGEAQAHSNGSNVYWDGGTRVEFPETGFDVQINTQLQTRYEYFDGDSDAGVDNASSFEVHRAKLVLSGHVLNKQFSYMLETSFQGHLTELQSRQLGGDRSPALQDAYIQWQPCDNGHLKLGQFKPKLNRAFNNHSAKMQFADRSIVSLAVFAPRSKGAEGQWGFADNRFILGGQVFNGFSDGEGFNAAGNDTNHFGGVYGRASILGELDPYAEGDVEWSDSANLDMGFAYFYGEQNNPSLAPAVDTEGNFLSVDSNFKMKGWGVHGEFLWASLEEDVGPEIDVETLGGTLQVGYFIVPKKFELAARYGYLDCDDGKGYTGGCALAPSDTVNEVSVSANYFWWEHSMKAQLGYEYINNDLTQLAATASTKDIETNRIILQLSSWF